MKRGLFSAVVGLLVSAATPIMAQQVVGDLHGELPEGLTCSSCHTTDAWVPMRQDPAFNHAIDAGFSLEGRHTDATCVRCHTALVFDEVFAQPDDCAGCHIDVHQGSLTRPCAACHTTESFTDLAPGIIHPADFPLEGAHLQTSCESCHTDDLSGAFTPLDRECATCHMDEYLAVPLVDHEQLGFSTDCTECHSALSFRDVPFDHFTISGGFELTGAHASTDCTSCHSLPAGGVPTNPTGPEDCVACHLSDYQAEHAGAGFPTDCRACHQDTTWSGASFDHAFEIFSGPHRQEWNACSDCHTVPGDFSTFSCFACHTRPDMDDKHREESGYAYDSVTCLSCHPTGRQD